MPDSIPPPPGAVPFTEDATSIPPPSGATPFSADAQTAEPPPQTIGQKLWHGARQASEDVGLGMLEGVTGFNELVDIPLKALGLPNFHAAEASAALHSKVQHPWLEDLGLGVTDIGATLFGGGPEFAATLVPKAAEGAGILTRMGTQAARGTAAGTVMGAESGLISPTGQQDPGAALKQKGENVLKEGTLGAATGGVVGGGVGAGKEIAGAVSEWTGGKAAKLTEALRGEASGKAGEAAEVGATGSAKAASEEARLQADLAAKNDQLGKIRDIQEQIASRQAVRDQFGRDTARQLDPAATAELKTRVAARMRERVRDAEDLARKAGLKLEDARSFAVEQEAKIAEAEHVADQLAEELAAKPGMDAKTFGSRIQKVTDETYRKLVKVREDQSGYSAVRDSQGDNKISKLSIDSYVNKNLKDVANPTTRNFLYWIKREAGLPTKGEDTKPLTLARADSLRKTIDTIIRTKKITFENATTADAAEALHYARDIRSRLIDAMRKASPEWSSAFDKFKELSRPLDIFERKGPLAGLAREDPLSGEYNVLSGDVVGRVLQKTKKGANAFTRLVAEDPELKDDARKFFQRQLFGADGVEKTVTPEKLRSFMAANEDALKQTGLFGEFRNVKTSLEAAKEGIESAKSAAKSAAESVKTAEGETKAASGAVQSERDISRLAAKREQEALSAKPDTTSSNQASENAKKALDRLASEEKLKAGDIKETERLLKEAQARGEVSAAAMNKYDTFVIDLKGKNLLPKDVTSKAETVAKSLLKDGQISKATYDDLLGKISEVERANIEVANKKQILTYAIGSSLIGAGLAKGWDLYRLIRSTVIPQ